jgi:hypothetical protein
MTAADNVVTFKTRRRAVMTLVKVIIDETNDLEEGDLVAFQVFGGTLFGHWDGPMGKDRKGRFVARGSKDEYTSIGQFKYCQRDIDEGTVKIIGKVIGGLEPERIPYFVDV